MAKKKEKLSLEEMLEQALVNEEDRPYEVPENWVWTRLINILRPMASKKPNQDQDIFSYIDIDAIDNKNQRIYNPKSIPVEKAPSRASRKVETGDTLFSMVRPYLRNIAYVNEEYKDFIASTGFYVCKPTFAVDSKYLFHFLYSDYVINTVNKYMKGDNSPSIRSAEFESCAIPLPPITEQQRIVTIIEQLFEKLDTAKETVQNALDSFENRKAAILHKAFTGELTAKWREENRVSLDDWEDTKMKNLTLLVTKGASPRWQGVNYIDDDSQTLFVTSENVREGFIDLQKEKYLENKINDIQKRSVLQMGDILLNIVGASIGRAAIFKINKLANINQAVCLIRLKDNVSKEFICNYLNAPSAMQYYSTNKVDVARANLSLTDVNNMSLLLPSIEEQKEIVRILDNLLDNEQRAKELCDAIEKIDLMKKAILSRAFRGELGTNNPEEESAAQLLKEVLKEKI